MYFFLYDTDSPVQAFYLVPEPSGNCRKTFRGLNILFNLIASKDRNSDHNLTFCLFCHTVRKKLPNDN